MERYVGVWESKGVARLSATTAGTGSASRCCPCTARSTRQLTSACMVGLWPPGPPEQYHSSNWPNLVAQIALLLAYYNTKLLRGVDDLACSRGLQVLQWRPSSHRRPIRGTPVALMHHQKYAAQSKAAERR